MNSAMDTQSWSIVHRYTYDMTLMTKNILKIHGYTFAKQHRIYHLNNEKPKVEGKYRLHFIFVSNFPLQKPDNMMRHQIEPFSALKTICAGNSPQKVQWRGALLFSLICAWMNGSVNNREAVDLRCHHAHYDVTAMQLFSYICDDTIFSILLVPTKHVLFVPCINELCNHNDHFIMCILREYL